MAGITAGELRDELQGAFPPGVEEFVDWNDVPGDVLQAFAETIAATAVDAAERLRQDINPLTCGVTKLADWESVLKLSTTKTARTGTITQRRRAVISRLREYGPPSIPFIQAILGPLLDYADNSQLVILEGDKAAQNTAHTYAWTGSVAYNTGNFPTVYFLVRDDASVSAAGCWVDFTITSSNLVGLGVYLTSPTGVAISIQPNWTGSASSSTFRLYFKAFAGVPIFGLWQVEFFCSINSGTVTAVNLFCEGFGRDITKHDGSAGSGKFEWAAVYEPSKSNGSADLDAARAAARRINYGSRVGAIVLRSTGNTLAAGDYAFLPDDANALPDVMIPG
mgnify:CR=1 FL=1